MGKLIDNILNEVGSYYDRMLVNENRESRMRSKGRRYLRNLGYSDEAVTEMEGKIIHDLPNVRLGEYKFMLGVCRIVANGELNDGTTVMKLNRYLRLIASDAHINEYDSNLNGMDYQEIDSRFGIEQSNIDKADIERSNARELQSNDSYRIVKIGDFDTASEYGQYVSWCVTHDASMYDDYTAGGLGVFYFCLKDGFENVEAVAGDGCPLDAYGLSMIAVSVNEDGSCNTITCRWNHDHGGNDNVMDVSRLEEIVGRNFYKTFVPRSEEEVAEKKREIVNHIYENFNHMFDRNGIESLVELDYVGCLGNIVDKPYESDFDNYDDYDDALYEWHNVSRASLYTYGEGDFYEDEKYIIVNGEGELVWDEFFDYVWGGDGFQTVCVMRGNRVRMINVYTKQELAGGDNLEALIDFGDGYTKCVYKDKQIDIINSRTGRSILPFRVSEIQTWTPKTTSSGFDYFWVQKDGKFNFALVKEHTFYGWAFTEDFMEGVQSICNCGPYIMLVRGGGYPQGKYGSLLDPQTLKPILNGTNLTGGGWVNKAYLVCELNGNRHYMDTKELSKEITPDNVNPEPGYDRLAFENIIRESIRNVMRTIL